MIFAFAIVCLLVFVYARWVEPSLIVTTHHTVENTRVSPEADGLVIVQFSDTHLSRYFTLEMLQHAVDKINMEKPDFVFFTGDLIDNIKTYGEDPSAVSTILAGIEATQGKFAVYGNHDYGAGAHKAYKSIMTDAGFTVLVNDIVDFAELGLSVIGLDDFVLGSGSPAVLKEANEDCLNLLLCHEPDVLDLISAVGKVDFMVAGHSHGGQVKLPLRGISYYPNLGSKYTEGFYSAGTDRPTLLYTNRGLGTTKLPLRFFAVPELSVFTLKTKG